MLRPELLALCLSCVTAALLTGCGGAGIPQGTAVGSISVAVIFPAQPDQVSPQDLPLATRSVRVVVLHSAPPLPPAPFMEALLTRGAPGEVVQTTFPDIPVGDYFVRALGYASDDGTGQVIARAEAPAVVAFGQNTQVVLVTQALVTRVEVTPPTPNLEVGRTAPLAATCYDADGSVVLCTVNWSSSDEAIALVDINGVVTARAVGEATITATEEQSGVAATGTVTVVARAGYVLVPTAMSLTVPAGTSNGARDGLSAATAFVDDVLLDSLTFDGATYTGAGGGFQAVQRFTVVSVRGGCRPDFADLDTGADGNPNPFVKAGLLAEGLPVPNSMLNSADPTVQDPAIQAALSDLSVSEGIDGRGQDYAFDVIFHQGVVDNDGGVDTAPELIFFERGANSSFTIQVITGGTAASPTLSPVTMTVSLSDLWASGYFVDTIATTTGQELGVAGLDLSDFGLGVGEVAYGVRIGSINATGADLMGVFAAAPGPGQFRPVPAGLTAP